jgi:hypothetical protein
VPLGTIESFPSKTIDDSLWYHHNATFHHRHEDNVSLNGKIAFLAGKRIPVVSATDPGYRHLKNVMNAFNMPKAYGKARFNVSALKGSPHGSVRLE